MEVKPKVVITGTKISSENQQLLISTGIPSLDDLLGGGLAVGTVALIDEDYQGLYSKAVLKYFLAEGIVNKHACLVASLDCDPQSDILYTLPAENVPEKEKHDPRNHLKKKDDEKMVIAFRYQNVLKDNDKSINQYGHYFDLSKKMSTEIINSATTSTWNGGKTNLELGRSDLFFNGSYWSVLQNIKDYITTNKYLLTDNVREKKILRIGIHQLGSPLWQNDDLQPDNTHMKNLRLFMLYLRCIIRKAFAVCVITVPTFYSEQLASTFSDHLVHNSDVAVKLDSFAGTQFEKNPVLAEYHGFFSVCKLAAINSLTSYHPGAAEYTFKLKRKKLVIEKLHLPPDLQEISKDIKKPSKPSLGCGSSDKHLLEF